MNPLIRPDVYFGGVGRFTGSAARLDLSTDQWYVDFR